MMNSQMPPIIEETKFEKLWRLGYLRLVPIVPPTAPLSERSSLAKRKDARGKAVGIKGRDGAWYGFDWLPYEADEADLARWHAMGAGVGIKTGNGLVLIDADTMNEDYARIIRDVIELQFGRMPVRVGQYPKAGYLCRVTDPFRYSRIEFGTRDDKGQLSCRVEILSNGRQFVAEGIHPKTGSPYYWPREIVPFEALPLYTPQQLTALLVALAEALPSAGPIIREGATQAVSQAALTGSLETVRKAVAATPNTSEAFPSRESYRDYGYAIKAALPDNPDEAFSLFADWCSRWTGGENDPNIVAADWRRMKPPFKRGANWLYELAEQHGSGSFDKAEIYFQPIIESGSPFAHPTATHASVKSQSQEPLQWRDPTTWEGQALPVRDWVVFDWIPKGEVTLLYGDGGVGKSLLAHQFATCAATGRDWLGQKTRQARVMCFFCEDSEEELHRRQHDINGVLGVSFPELGSLRLVSRKHMDNLFVVWDRNTGSMKKQAVWEMLLADAKAFGADVIVVDTIADTYSGSEIDRVQVNAFVKSCLGRLAQEIGGSVVALGHPSVAGKSSGQGTSGSTAWSNAARSRLYLRHPKGVDRGNIRELEGMKLNYGPKGSLLKLRWARGAFEVISGARPSSEGDAALVSSIKSTRDAAQEAVVSVLLSNPTERLVLAHNSPYFAPRVLKKLAPEVLDAFTPDEVRAAVDDLMRSGTIKAAEVGRDASSRPVHGFVVVIDKLSVTGKGIKERTSEIGEPASSVFS